jgi:membrane protease subunit HflK
MSSDESPGLRQVLMVLAAMFAFSLMAFFTRGAQAHILGVAAWRAVFVAVIFAISTVAVEGGVQALRPEKTTLRLGAWLGVALAIASSTFVGGYALTTVANTIFLHNMAPVVVFPLAWWLYKERPQGGALTGAGIALFGVALLTGVSLFQVTHYANARFLLGDLLALISAVGYGAVIVITRMTRRAETPILGTLFVGWAVAAVLLVAVAWACGALFVPGSALIWILGLAVLCTNVPFYLLNLGMRSVSAGTAAVLSLSEVLFATLLGIVVYGEHLAPIGWIGGILAGLGVLYAMTQRDDSTETAASTSSLDEVTRGRRLWRVLLGLGLLNGGVLMGMASGGASSVLMALAGLTVLARLGPSVAHAWLDGRFGRIIGWTGAGVAAVAAGGCFLRSGTLDDAGSLWGMVLALVVLALDRRLAAGETEREDQPLVHLALLLLAGGHALGWMQHGMAHAITEAANFALGWAAVGLVVAGLSGGLIGARPASHGALERFDGPGRWFFQGKRPLAAACLVWIAGGIHLVPTGHVGIVERFGAPISQTDGAGLFLRAPAPLEALRVIDVSSERRLSLYEDGRTLLTGDQSMVSLDGVVHYTISDPERFAYGSSQPEEVLRDLARSSLVQVVVHGSQDAVLTTGRLDLESAVLGATQAQVDSAGLGIQVTAVHLTEAAVPPPVLAAFLDVISADEERLTRINEGEAYAAKVIPEARGQALASISGAQGAAAKIQASADAASLEFLAISAGGAKAPSLTRARMTWESLETRLKPARLVLAPAGVRVWWGKTDGSKPVDIKIKDTTGSKR